MNMHNFICMLCGVSNNSFNQSIKTNQQDVSSDFLGHVRCSFKRAFFRNTLNVFKQECHYCMNVFKSSLWLIIMRNYRVILSLITVVRFILIRLIGILMRFRGEHRHYYVQIESISSYIAVHLFEDR